MICIATIETFVWALNEKLVVHELMITDVGGSIVLHMFGAYFGVACSIFLSPKEAKVSP